MCCQLLLQLGGAQLPPWLQAAEDASLTEEASVLVSYHVTCRYQCLATLSHPPLQPSALLHKRDAASATSGLRPPPVVPHVADPAEDTSDNDDSDDKDKTAVLRRRSSRAGAKAKRAEFQVGPSLLCDPL
jgi:hypothetical protein